MEMSLSWNYTKFLLLIYMEMCLSWNYTKFLLLIYMEMCLSWRGELTISYWELKG